MLMLEFGPNPISYGAKCATVLVHPTQTLILFDCVGGQISMVHVVPTSVITVPVATIMASVLPLSLNLWPIIHHFNLPAFETAFPLLRKNWYGTIFFFFYVDKFRLD